MDLRELQLDFINLIKESNEQKSLLTPEGRFWLENLEKEIRKLRFSLVRNNHNR